jgi:hypothetical protein
MKKLIETKKIIVTAWILFIALFIFPPSSFGGEPITGLVFDFGGLPVELPGLPEGVTVRCAIVDAPGRELIIITPSGQYKYYAKLEAGMIYATATENNFPADCIDLIEWLEKPQKLFSRADLVIFFESATLSEHFTIEGEIPEDPEEVEVPEDVNLFFKVQDAKLLKPDIEGSFDLMLKLKHGSLLFIMFKP